MSTELNEHGCRVVVVGNGMVGHKFCERMLDYDTDRKYTITIFGEEEHPAYNRVQLTSYFDDYDARSLAMEGSEWYAQNGITLHLGQRVSTIDRLNKRVISNKGVAEPYDILIISTGSSAFVPDVPGVDKDGVFVYRTIDDLDAIRAYAERSVTAAVVGGGLLGLEAAKACAELGLRTTVLERSSRLMSRQLDDKGGRILMRSVESLGVSVKTNVSSNGFLGNGRVTGVSFEDGSAADYDMVVISAGITPNDQLAREFGLEIGARGGITVNAKLQTSDADIYAVGECALFEDRTYGLVAPGYDMADIVAANICGGDRLFAGADMSTKLKLMGVHVASLGDPFVKADSTVVEVHDTNKGIYKKLIMSPDARKLHGAILVGDATEYGALSLFVKGNKDLPESPESLIISGAGGGMSLDTMEDTDVVCSCNNVTKGDISRAITEDGVTSIGELKRCTRAGTGCGGCLQMVSSILKHDLEKLGIETDPSICEHFSYSRQDLFQIAKVKELRTFAALLEHHGRGHGCEVCKTTIASILASLWNAPVLEEEQILDTNDRYLANIQRNGTYSVIPRSPGGELTPDQLIAMGEVAKKYDLYTKLTGSQRVALFGAHVNDLPAIWETLNAVGLESGHAYAKGLRMVKSCVGSTWCRFGVDAAVDVAIELENRYKGLRSPHKLKGAVSGCTRECAEAMSKDFGLVATEQGWNLYVGGNGGTFPRHAELLASDIDHDTVVRYIDRFLMYYIMTADKLQRTATWITELDGGVDKVRDVVVHDSLGICAELEAAMQRIVDTQIDEWADAVADPKKAARFQHFANSDARDSYTRNITVRAQRKPLLWAKDAPAAPAANAMPFSPARKWVKLGEASEVPENGGQALRYGRHQIAVFNFTSMGKWYACQNLCPHKREMVLARGMLGDMGGIPKVVCPMHKKAFSLEDGKNTNGEAYRIQTFDIEIRNGYVFVQLPSEADLDKLHVCDPTKHKDSMDAEDTTTYQTPDERATPAGMRGRSVAMA
jgi:nitrite reductase (NADH) large subunit